MTMTLLPQSMRCGSLPYVSTERRSVKDGHRASVAPVGCQPFASGAH